jgi:hypothetical protein
VTTRAQVRELLDEGHSYEDAGHALGIPAGLAFMVATGLPADDSEARAPAASVTGSPQDLVNPPSERPARKQYVLDWVHERARRELKQPR